MCSSTPDEPGSDTTHGIVPQSFKYICSWPRCALWYWHQKAMDARGWVKPNSSVVVIVLLNHLFVLAGLCRFWGVAQVFGECEVVEVVVVGSRSGAGLVLAPCPARWDEPWATGGSRLLNFTSPLYHGLLHLINYLRASFRGDRIQECQVCVTGAQGWKGPLEATWSIAASEVTSPMSNSSFQVVLSVLKAL